MRGVLISVVAAVAWGVVSVGEAAHADDAYVCEGGRIAYVRFGDLEAMKRRDPCIAAYYGQSSRDDAAGADGEADASMTSDASDADAADLVVRTTATQTRSGSGAPGKHVAAPVLKSGPRLATPARRAATGKVAASGTVGRIVERTVAPPVAHPETDFRNVRVLNAAPGDDTVYRHLR